MGMRDTFVSDEEKKMNTSKKNDINIEYINRKVPLYNTNNANYTDKLKTTTFEKDTTDKVYNCYTCNIQIYNHSFLRFHFKTEWHKYNLKRKLLNLRCVDEITFNEKVSNLNKKQDEKKAKQKGKDQDEKKIKKKKEKKEKEKEKKNNVNNRDLSTEFELEYLKKTKYATPEKVLLEKNVPYVNPLICFFDNKIFDSIEKNRDYMKKEYTFSLPDEKYVTSFKKIYTIIGKTIYEENMCIYCFKYFKCVKAVQTHMICNGHTKIDDKFTFLIEKYYDFTKTYVDLINRYIQSKEDKEKILQLIDTIQEEKRRKRNKKKGQKKKATLKEHPEINILEIKENGEEKHKEKNIDALECLDVSQGNTSESENDVLDDHVEGDENGMSTMNNENLNKSDYNLTQINNNEKIKLKKQTENGQIVNMHHEVIVMKNEEENLSICEDYKIKEEDLNKNIDADVIYEALEHMGYCKPELNEFNNLVLPDGTEAVNRNLAYIFQQDFSIFNRKNSEIVAQVEKLEKKEKPMDYKHMKYYVEYMKKFNLDISLKANKLNKFMKTESICFF